MPVEATPVGDDSASEIGTLTFLDNAVDSLTGTIQLKARFANRDRALWPGALVRVVLELDIERDALVVPADGGREQPAGERGVRGGLDAHGARPPGDGGADHAIRWWCSAPGWIPATSW